MPPLESDLGHAELEVLKILWEDSPATVREVWNRLQESGRDIAYTTVLTFLTRLEQKGFVTSDKSARAFAYRPEVTQEKVSRSRLRTLIDHMYDGAAGPLVLQLVKDERFTPEEITELHALIDELDSPQKRTRKSGGRL